MFKRAQEVNKEVVVGLVKNSLETLRTQNLIINCNKLSVLAQILGSL